MLWTPPAFRGALVRKSVDTTAIDATAGHTLVWDQEAYDTDNIHGLAATVTITIATPGVVTWTGHNFLAGAPIVFATTGALPTGITAGTIYYVLAPAANTFNIAATPGGAAIATSGTQSGVHTATNNSRLTVPAGVTRVRLHFGITFLNVALLEYLYVQMQKNGVSAFDGAPRQSCEVVRLTFPMLNLTSPPLVVVATDYFTMQVTTETDTSIDVQATTSYFGMEILAP